MPKGTTSGEKYFMGRELHLLDTKACTSQEWDYTVLTVADPLTRLLQLAEEVRPPQPTCCLAASIP